MNESIDTITSRRSGRGTFTVDGSVSRLESQSASDCTPAAQHCGVRQLMVNIRIIGLHPAGASSVANERHVDVTTLWKLNCLDISIISMSAHDIDVNLRYPPAVTKVTINT